MRVVYEPIGGVHGQWEVHQNEEFSQIQPMDRGRFSPTYEPGEISLDLVEKKGSIISPGP